MKALKACLRAATAAMEVAAAMSCVAGLLGNAAQAQGNAPAVLQVPTTSSLFNPYYGSVQSVPAEPAMLKLSLDDALRLGLRNNLGLVYARENEDTQRAQRLLLLNVLLPNLDIRGVHGLHQYNLQAEGFRPGLLSQLGALLGSGGTGGTAAAPFSYIVKVNETEGQAYLTQDLFNLAGYDVVRAVGHSEKAARMSSSDSRATVVLNVGTAYLRALATEAEVSDARALLKTDEATLYQNVERHKAGISANLDELRARVQFQTQQQTVIVDENNLAKAHIALNRAIGLAPEQEVELAEATPYAELDAMSPAEATRTALAGRQDYQSLVEQLHTYEWERKAATHERFPTVSFNSNYGVTGVNGLVYHDTWMAAGVLSVPIFQEAKFRSDRDTAEYQLQTTRSRIANLRGQIDQQVRDSLIDLRTAQEVFQVAKSNRELATTALEQAGERFRAGVEDNLPSIQATSTLASSETQYATAVFQLNTARLGLARNLGMIDTAYAPDLPGGRPAGLTSGRTTAATVAMQGK